MAALRPTLGLGLRILFALALATSFLLKPAGAPLVHAASAAPGFAVTDFATGFPNQGIGPIGVAFDSTNQLFVMDLFSGQLFTFGPSGGPATTPLNATPIPGSPTGIAFAKDGRLYAARQHAEDIVELSPTTGAVLRVVGGVPGATGLATDPISGDLFASDPTGSGIYRISNFAAGPGAVTHYASTGATDGLTFAPDGTLYAAIFGQSIAKVAGTNSSTPGAFSVIADLPLSDGAAVANTAPGQPPVIFGNRNDGIITRIDLSTSPPTLTNIVTGGSRGDFVAVGPDGCLYATQTDRVIKVTNADGTCSLAPTSALPQLTLAPAAISPSPTTGTTETFTATLKNVSNPAGLPITFTVDGANPRTGSVPADASGTAVFSYAGTAAGTDTITASTTVDDKLVRSNSGTVTWVLPANRPPTAKPGGPYSVPEGGSLQLAGSGSDPDGGDALIYAWDLDGDGTFETAGDTATFSAVNLDGPVSTTAALKVCDNHDACSTANATINVTNVAPSITAVTAAGANAVTGAAVTFTGAATDPSAADTAAGLRWQWSVDGGPYSAASTSNVLSYALTTCGDHTVSARVLDKDGGVSMPVASSIVKAYDAHFLPPLNEGIFNTVQAGRVVPVKVSVGCGGVALAGLAPGIQLLKGNVSPTNEVGADPVETLSVSAADTTGLMRDAGGFYLYNLRVPSDASATPGALYTIRVRPFGDTNPSAAMYIVLQIK